MKRAAVWVAAFALGACNGDDGACTTELLAEDCAPLYVASGFDDVHRRTLVPKCSNGACHDAYSAKGGLNLATPEAAYTGLVTEGRVIPDGCSTLLERVDTDDPSWSMPPGQGLSEAERCVIHTWVRAGAPR